MKTVIIATILLISSLAFADGRIYLIEDAGPTRCWDSNYVIQVEDGYLMQTWETFCNFYCYQTNYQVVCDGVDCWDTFDIACLTDGEPNKVVE